MKLRLRADPAHAGRHIRKYENRLVSQFRKYKEAAVLQVSRATRGRHMAAEPIRPDLNMEVVSRVLGELVDVYIVIPGKRITEEQSLAAYRQGLLYASQQLKRVGIASDMVLLPGDRDAVEVLTTRNLAALRGISEEMNKRIISELSDGLMKGEGMDKLTRRIRNSVDTIGITRARLLARTETMYSTNQAALTRYFRMGVKRVMWITAGMDGRVCEKCMPLNGKIFPIERVPDIPFHVNCRCTVVPVLD